MISREELKAIIESKWCTLPDVWEHGLRSNSVFKVLDLTCPGTFGVHVAYSMYDDSLLYIYITVPKDSDINYLLYHDEQFDSCAYMNEDYCNVSIFRRELTDG